jgi:GNAT superfamily N-acetyltransferase
MRDRLAIVGRGLAPSCYAYGREPRRVNAREIIRVAEDRDASAVAQVYIDSWNSGFVGLAPERRVDTELVARWKKDLLAPLPHRWWVAELNGQIVGFSGICPSRDPVNPRLGELDTIAVDPNMWRRGYGRALMAIALAYLVRDGYHEAVLWTWANYERGRVFYEKTEWFLDGRTRDEGRQVLYRHHLSN